MNDIEPESLILHNPWEHLRKLTRARIALGRVGNSLPTDELLRFGVAHAQARDAVHLSLNVEQINADLKQENFAVLHVRSAARDRPTYLLRPDFGRRLATTSATLLNAREPSGCDILFVIADGLSAQAVQHHAVPLLKAARAQLEQFNIGPVVIVEQGRVAVADEIGEILGAKIVVIAIGERPGLSSPDSLGLYITHAPKIGRSDAERNCISNIRPEGLSYAEAATKLTWLLSAAFRLGYSGVNLKDGSEGQLAGLAMPSIE